MTRELRYVYDVWMYRWCTIWYRNAKYSHARADPETPKYVLKSTPVGNHVIRTPYACCCSDQLHCRCIHYVHLFASTYGLHVHIQIATAVLYCEWLHGVRDIMYYSITLLSLERAQSDQLGPVAMEKSICRVRTRHLIYV